MTTLPSTPFPSLPRFGDRVRKQREGLGFTREQLAHKIGCAAVTLYKIETHERRPSLQLAQLLAQHLNIPAEEVIEFVHAARGIHNPPRSSLPAALTTLIGREDALQQISAQLKDEAARLLTLTGSPGVGKTQLALAAARALHTAFVDGAYFVSLSALSTPEQVRSAIAQTLGIGEANGDQSLWHKTLQALRHKNLLLLLDNFEQVLTAAPSVAELLQTCPHVKVLITSQAALRLTGEHVWPVAPLAVAPAVHLFVARAQAIKPTFRLNPSNTALVTEICQRLDGLPLAIELAATRISLFTPAALLAQLSQRFAVLGDGAADAPSRHQTLWNAIDWSYGLLQPDAQRAWRCAAIFAGSFSLESFQDIAELDAQRALDLVTTLVHHSLLAPLDSDSPRFMLLESLRAYAQARLIATDEHAALRKRHAQHYLALAVQAAEHLPGTAQSHWLSLLRRELDNLRCALREWIDRADFDHAAHMATALTNFWVSCGLLSEGQTWFNSVLALRTPASLTKADEQTILRYARVLGDASVPALLRGALSETRDYLNAALSLVNRLGNTERAVRIIAGLGVIDMIEGRYADAVTKIEHALGHLREEGPSAQSGMALYNLGVIAGWQGDAPRMTMRLTEAYEMNAQIGNQSGAAQALALHAYFLIPGGALTQAQTLCDQSLQLSHSVDDEACVAIGTGVLARMALTQGRMADAAEHFASALRTLSEQGRQEFCLYCLEGLAQIAAMTQQPQRAARLFGSVEGIRKRTGIAEPLSERERNLSAIALAQNVMGQTAYAMAVADGRAMNFAQAVAFALMASHESIPENNSVYTS